MLSSAKENRQFGFRTFPFLVPSAPVTPHGTGLSATLYRCDPPLGTEELGHFEMVCAIVYQLTRNISIDDIKKSGFAPYYVDHTTGLYPIAASGEAFTANTFQSTGDPIADLHEDLAAEQKARLTYDNILRLADDPDVRDAIKFLRAREIVHFQRFGECLRLTQEQLDAKNFYAYNPSFDKR